MSASERDPRGKWEGNVTWSIDKEIEKWSVEGRGEKS